MYPDDSSLEREDTQMAADSSLESTVVQSDDLASVKVSKLRLLRDHKKAFVVAGLLTAAIIPLSIGAVVFVNFHNSKQAAQASAKKATSYAVSNLPLGSVKANQQLQANTGDHLTVNGQLRVSNSLVLTPTSAPSAPIAGQIYYQQSTNTPYYYNGTQFVSLVPTATPQHVASLGGISGAINVGNGLEISNNQLGLTNAVIQELSKIEALNTSQNIQGDNDLAISSPIVGQVLQYNGSKFGNGLITNANLQAGDFSNITGVGGLSVGSIALGFGAISTGSNITTTAILQGGTVNAGLGTLQTDGTDRIDNTGNLLNIGTITSGLINGQTIGSAANFTGTLVVTTLGSAGSSLLCYNASSQISSCGAGGYIVNGVTTQQNANFNIQSSSASTVSGVIESAISQTADLLDFQNSSGAVLSGFTASGALQGGNASGSDMAGAPLTVAGGQGTGLGSGGNINLQIANPGTVTSPSLNSLSTVASFSGTNGAANFQNSTNSANAFQVQNASGSELSDTLLNINTQAPTNNLVTNPSFEQDTNGWAAKGNMAISKVTGVIAPYGSAALQITNNGTPALLDGAKYPVSLLSNTTYSFTFYAKLASGSFSTLAVGRADNGSTDTTCSGRGGIVSTSTLSTTTWTRVSCTFTTGTVSGSPYIFIGQNDTTSRTWYVDGVALTQTSGLSSVSNIGFYDEGTLNLNGLALGNTLIQPTTNSNTAFVVASANGTIGIQADSINSNLDSSYALILSNREAITATNTLALSVRNATSDTPLLLADTTNLNLDTNGSFEYSTTSPPVSYAANHSGVNLTVDTTVNNAYTGNNTGKVVTSTSAVANSGMNYALTTSTLAAGTYTLSFYAKITSGTFTTLDAGWSSDGSTENTCTLSSNTVITYWQRYTCTFTAGAASNTPYFFIGQSDSGVAHTYFLDGIELESGSSFDNYREGKIQLNGDITSPTVFRPQSDSNSALQIQNASGTSLLSVDSANMIITIGGTSSSFGSLTLSNAHFKSTQTTAPTKGTPTNCGGGTGPSAAVSAGSTDSAGSFTITAGTTGSPSTCDTVITFNKTYGAAPKSVIITPTTTVGSATNQREAYVSAISATSFTVKVNTNLTGNTPANGEVFSYYYWVIE